MFDKEFILKVAKFWFMEWKEAINLTSSEGKWILKHISKQNFSAFSVSQPKWPKAEWMRLSG